MSDERILSIGTMYLDINSTNFPIGSGLMPETETVGNSYELAPGGSALFFARVCASLGLRPIFIGKLGNDRTGAVLEELVKDIGVEPAFIKSPEVSTTLGMNFIGEEKQIMTVAGTANQSLSGEEVMAQFEKNADNLSFLYLGGCFKLKSLTDTFGKLVEAAKKRSIKVIIDHGRVTNRVSAEDRALMRSLIQLADFYLPSRDEFMAVWDVESIEEGLSKVRRVSNAVVVVKQDQDGATGMFESEVVHVPAFKINVLNNVGAGDSFNAGFIRAQVDGLGFDESIRFANAAAAIKISTPDFPTVVSVEAIISKGA